MYFLETSPFQPLLGTPRLTLSFPNKKIDMKIYLTKQKSVNNDKKGRSSGWAAQMRWTAQNVDD